MRVPSLGLVFVLALALTLALANAEELRSLQSSSLDDCVISASSSSICGYQFMQVMQSKYAADACASAYFRDVASCTNLNCVYVTMPKDKCECGTSYDSLDACLNYGSPTQNCRSTLRVWYYACLYPNNCMSEVVDEIATCATAGPFQPCLNNALRNATCNIDPANMYSSANSVHAKGMVFGVFASILTLVVV